MGEMGGWAKLKKTRLKCEIWEKWGATYGRNGCGGRQRHLGGVGIAIGVEAGAAAAALPILALGEGGATPEGGAPLAERHRSARRRRRDGGGGGPLGLAAAAAHPEGGKKGGKSLRESRGEGGCCECGGRRRAGGERIGRCGRRAGGDLEGVEPRARCPLLRGEVLRGEVRALVVERAHPVVPVNVNGRSEG